MKRFINRVRDFWHADISFVFLFVILLFTVFVLPVMLSTEIVGTVWLDLILILIFFIGIFSADSKVVLFITAFLFLVHVALKVIRYSNNPYSFIIVEDFIAALNVFVFIIINFRLLFRDEHFNIHRVTGAVNIYLLLALLGAIGFQIIQLATGSSIKGEIPLTNSQKDFSEYLYYSMASLTTVGYGDIFPVNPAARMLSVFLSAVGILFPAVIIARLVGLAKAEKGNSDN